MAQDRNIEELKRELERLIARAERDYKIDALNVAEIARELAAKAKRRDEQLSDLELGQTTQDTRLDKLEN